MLISDWIKLAKILYRLSLVSQEQVLKGSRVNRKLKQIKENYFLYI